MVIAADTTNKATACDNSRPEFRSAARREYMAEACSNSHQRRHSSAMSRSMALAYGHSHSDSSQPEGKPTWTTGVASTGAKSLPVDQPKRD
jgi:hypothetical protein